MASWIQYLNRLLPFATPGTPLLQDLVHLAVICALLYFAPQLQDYLQQRNAGGEPRGERAAAEPEGENQAANEELNALEEDENEAGDLDQEAFEQEADFQDAGPDNDEFREFQRQQANEAPEAGPADGPNTPTARNVGAKKAKSLARRDQKRAYNEFQRTQGEAQRARDAEGASEREAAQAKERERRKAAEAKLEAKKAKEREQRREQERREREAEISRRELALNIVRRELDEQRMSNLFEVARQIGGDADDVWLERLLNANNVLGRSSDGTLTTVTSMGWVVRVRRENMMRVYKKAAEDGLGDENGKIGYEEISELLEAVLKKQ